MTDGLRITRRGDRVCIQVHLQPRASRTEIAGLSGDALRVRVTAPPVDDRANEELVRFLAGALDLPTRSVQIVQGHRSRRKTIGFEHLDEAELLRRLTQYVV